MSVADDLIAELGLAPHPEGGHFREVYRAPLRVTSDAHDGPRAASTAIYFLLAAGELSAFHRVRSDEAWHHYAGDVVELCCFDGATATHHRLGKRLESGERPLALVPAGVLQAARVLPGAHGFALCGCTVAPGFEFADFELPSRAELLAAYPDHAALIATFTRA